MFENSGVIAFFLATALVLCLYSPILLPLVNGELVFAYGDLTSVVGHDSVEARNSFNYYTFNEGYPSEGSNRAFLIQSVTLFTGPLGLTDAQSSSILILISILLGSYGLYLLVTFFNKEYAPLLILTAIPFYFLNLWSIDRIGHMWIWIAYAIFPLFLSVGLSYIFGKKSFFLVSYSVLFAFFGIMPHSFIYLLSIHLFLVIFSLSYRKDLKTTLIFSFVPILIYALLSLPALSLSVAADIVYPYNVNVFDLQFLSRYGELTNALTMSNNWWPQIETEKILNNQIFRFASLAIFVGILSAFLLGCKKIGRNEKTLALLSLLSVFILIFVAQGVNNELIRIFIDMLDADQLQMLAPFREWARISILIPVFLLLALLVSIPRLEKKEKQVLLSLILFVVWLNILSSPVFEYLGRAYSATEITKDYYEISTLVPKEHKILWVMPSQADFIMGWWYRYAWNPDKAAGWITAGLGSSYYESDTINSITEGEASQELVDALNIKYIIKRTDMLGASGFKVNYPWLDCEKLEYLIVCENEGDPKAFSLYNSTDAEITGFTRVNPTLWYVNVSAKKPFTLVFAEPYNPLWDARIYENGEKTGTVKPVELYGVINGYQINATGDLHLEMRYIPQDTFEAAMPVSVISLLACIIYLIMKRNDVL